MKVASAPTRDCIPSSSAGILTIHSRRQWMMGNKNPPPPPTVKPTVRPCFSLPASILPQLSFTNLTGPSVHAAVQRGVKSLSHKPEEEFSTEMNMLPQRASLCQVHTSACSREIRIGVIFTDYITSLSLVGYRLSCWLWLLNG